MRKNFGAKALLYPMPVLIIGTYNKDGSANAMNAAWGGIADDTKISICLSKEHKTVENLLERKAFTVSVGTAKCVTACDYVGIVSGNKESDKFEKAGFHAEKSEFVDAPLIKELPFSLECKFVSYDEKNSLLIGEIINVSSDESILNKDGKIDLAKLEPITYDPSNHKYVTLGTAIADAFSEGQKLK